MKRLRAIRRWSGPAAAFGWLALAGAPLARAAAAAEQAAPSSGANKYLASYAIVLLGIGLGLLFVCNSARRRDRESPEKYGE